MVDGNKLPITRGPKILGVTFEFENYLNFNKHCTKTVTNYKKRIIYSKKFLPVKKHNEMLSKQFLCGCYQEHRADHHTINYKGFNRNIRPTLERKFKPDIEHLLNENRENISKLEYVNGIKNLRTTEVQNFHEYYQFLSPNESKHDRKTRCTLSQLRSGYSTQLASYHHRLKNKINNVCPSCYIGSHTTDHLFKCRVHPTSLTIKSLWENPEEAANNRQLIT